ncbi:hypothetical protein [Glycomyces paridis]|uniref:Uncharacterized protein n=1 Tax=Glycomyces paridis TaxID=2126555 RepID=A0A4S8P9K7_9ACTN|nr:hypothetical protein [Glycomyces paridis]THV24509.1 hypothetical protein E9998_21075 [Glycomyces paridis]
MSHHHPDALGFSEMPGGGKFVVVLLWIRFGLGICATFGLITLVNALNGMPEAAALLPDWYDGFVAFSVVQTIVWVILYAVFAVRLPQRRQSARTGVITLEIVGLALAVLSFGAMQGTYNDLAAQGADFTSTYVGSCLGAVMSFIVIGILSGAEMKSWCDR